MVPDDLTTQRGTLVDDELAVPIDALIPSPNSGIHRRVRVRGVPTGALRDRFVE